jgi:hypothetical protein
LSLLTLFQSPDDGIQTNLLSAAVLTEESFPGAKDGWNSGTGARGGVLTSRPGTNWNDLVDVRAVHGPGVYTGIDPETVFTGTLSVAEVNGPLARLEGKSTLRYGLKVNGRGALFARPSIDHAADPMVVISPLTLTTHYDVGGDAVAVTYTEDSPSPEATLREQLVAGRGGAGVGNGVWTGPGITSSAAAAANETNPESRAVGYADNPAAGEGDLIAAGENDPSVLIRYTHTGDANLDGVVNDDDLTIIGANYAPGVANPHWALGDFDYNGFVDDDDVTLLGAFYDPAAAPPGPAEVSGADSSMVAMAVPEPSTVTLFGMFLAAMAVPVVRRRVRCGVR